MIQYPINAEGIALFLISDELAEMSLLVEELKSINPQDYQDKKDYDDRIKALNIKIDEIEQTINNRPVSDAAAKNLVEWFEPLHNGQPIDWDFWSPLNNITSAQAAKLAHNIDPISWPDDRYAAGNTCINRCDGKKMDDRLFDEIQRLKQQLEHHSIIWNLIDLVVFLGEESAPFGMNQAASNKTEQLAEALGKADAIIRKTKKPIPIFNRRLSVLEKWLTEDLKLTLTDEIIILPKHYTLESVYTELCKKDGSLFLSIELSSFNAHFWGKQKIVQLMRGPKPNL